MKKLIDLVYNEKLQYIVFLSLSLSVTVLTGIISNTSSFQRYFGDTNPLIVIVLITILGIVLLSYLLIKEQFKIYKKKDIKGLFFSTGLAVPFVVAIIKRYDFISMYSFRLVYYLFWHILWGYVRLKLLF